MLSHFAVSRRNQYTKNIQVIALLIPYVNTIEKISFHYNFISIFCEHHQNMEEDKNEKERQLLGISFYSEETGGKVAKSTVIVVHHCRAH